jgi:hypothetical protein
MDVGEIAILAVGSVTTLVPWLLETSGVVLPKTAVAMLGWVSIAAFSWGLAKLLWSAEPNKLRFVTISVSGLVILCIAIFIATLWGCKFYWPQEPAKLNSLETLPTTTVLAPEPTTSASLTKEDDLALKPTHPRLTILISEPGENAIIGLVIKNIGGTDAHDVRIIDIRAGGHIISFPYLDLLEHGDTTFPMLPKVNDFGSLQQNHIGLAMMDGWRPMGRTRILPSILIFPATALYSDSRGNHFRVSWEYNFYPHKYDEWMSTRPESAPSLLETTGPYLLMSKVMTERLRDWAES